MDEHKPEADVDLADTERVAFSRLLDMLHTEYQFDFREYKSVSLLRRVRARMSQVRVEGFDTYIDYLRLHAHEAAALFNTLLLNVTGFFRDPEAWEVLRREALPPLLTAAVPAGRLRVWSAGCSTGEETYSAAILIADALGPRAAELDVKIYATDIDDDALSAARRAVFRVDQLKDVPADPPSVISPPMVTRTASAGSCGGGVSSGATTSRRIRRCRRSTCSSAATCSFTSRAPFKNGSSRDSSTRCARAVSCFWGARSR